jgi:hypothetical protein
MPTKKNGRRPPLRVEVLEPREAPTATPWASEAFDATRPGALPAGWSPWAGGPAAVGVSPARALSAPGALAVSAGLSNVWARSWLDAVPPADVQVSAAVYLDTLIPAQVIARGTDLATAAPSYYAVQVTRGLKVDLVRVVHGVATTLAALPSPPWFSGRWVRVALDVEGDALRAQVVRTDTGQYLNGQGRWQTAPAWALQAADASLPGPGQAGLGRPASYTGTVTFDDFRVDLPPLVESFDHTSRGELPAGWRQWDSTGPAAFAVSPARSLSAPNGLTVTASSSRLAARAWPGGLALADLQASAAVYLDTLIPAEVFGRGTNLAGAAPSYYAVSVARGLQVQLLRERDGVPAVLGQVDSASWVSNVWVRAGLYVSGSTLRAQVLRLDTGQYLTDAGQWQDAPAWALSLTDTVLTGAGEAGLARPASYTGSVTFDDFALLPASGDDQPPTVTLTAPAAETTLSGVVSVRADASDDVGVVKVTFAVDGTVRATRTAAPYSWDLDTTTLSNGSHTLQVSAYDAAGNVGRVSVTVVTRNDTAVPQPSFPQHYPYIRIAELAYAGTPLGSLEDSLLRNSVDLVVADPSYLAQIAAAAPATPQLLYTNVSSLYQGLLTGWLTYAAANGLDPESAFYHVTAATPFSGNSPSSQPVDWFWGVYRGGPTWADLTSQAHGSGPGGVAFAAAGQAVAVGYPEPFREINVSLAAAAGPGWAAAVEYPTQVDAAGNPTAWATLPLLGDTTAGLTRSGQLLFDPPAGWKAASLDGSTRLYYVRFRTTAAGTAPVANTILGEDYVHAGRGTSGVIPAFDYAADADHDGYLNAAEYDHAAPGMTAHFAYQGRLFYGSYGQMRFATDPSDAGFREWAVSHAVALLRGEPLAGGLFVDNSGGVAPAAPGAVVEPVASYADDYGSLLRSIDQAVAPHWLLANTAGGGTQADGVVSQVPGYYEEFGLRPLSANYVQFEDLAGLVARRAGLQSPAPYAVLDSLPAGGSPTDPRRQLATLAEYYLLADPQRSFLDLYGGYAPATSWAEHWFGAVTYDVGQPQAGWFLLSSGTDPGDARYRYRVYARRYANALVLYKPLSADAAGASGSLSDDTATALSLGGSYRPLRADGTLGPAVTSISLRNGEGAILVKATP